MSGDFAVQVPIFIEVGIKVHPMVFLGAYTALSFGGTSSGFGDAQGCTAGGQRSCLGSDFRIGLEAQLHFRPAERINPWVGYGFGFEEASASASGGGIPATGKSLSGLELARFAGGVDYRVSRLVGIGPFVGLDFGSYSHVHVQGAGNVTDQGISNSALHEWFTIGVRGVLFP